ncbi:hypothetical protein QOT17_025142 [Balamuthia mandrillaris]
MPAEGGIPPVPVGNITGMDDVLFLLLSSPVLAPSCLLFLRLAQRQYHLFKQQHYNKWEDIWANKRTMEQCLSQDTKYKNYIKKEEFFLRCGRSRKWRKRMCVLRFVLSSCFFLLPPLGGLTDVPTIINNPATTATTSITGDTFCIILKPATTNKAYGTSLLASILSFLLLYVSLLMWTPCVVCLKEAITIVNRLKKSAEEPFS